MAVITVTNIERDATGATSTTAMSGSKSAGPDQPVIWGAMIAVAAAAVVMWILYRFAIKPHPLGIAKSYVPYAAVIAVAAALERLLEPLSQLFMPSDAAKDDAAQSKSEAHVAAADPTKSAADVKPVVDAAVSSQGRSPSDKLRTNRTIVFWAIASICGFVISGWFGLFLLQSIATGPVNSFLDLAVTGLTIGATAVPRSFKFG
jgi:hypothetical protein